MSVRRVIHSWGDPDPLTGLAPRRVEVNADGSEDPASAPLRPVVEPNGPGEFVTVQRRCRLVKRIYVKGETSNNQGRYNITKPVTGRHTFWKGEDHTAGPLDLIYVVDDPDSEMYLDLVDALGNVIEDGYIPTATNGNPIEG